MKKIAIVKLSALGDIVHAMVALQFIKQRFPNLQIDWIVEEQFADILCHNPDIFHIKTVVLKALKKNKVAIFNEIQKVRAYAKENYDLVIDAQGLLKSAFVSYFLGKNRAGFDKNSIRESFASYFYQQKIACSYDTNTIDRNARILSEPLNFEISPQAILEKKPFLFFEWDNVMENLCDNNQKNVLFVIGSTWESRNYPKEKFVKIANQLKTNCIVIWGNQSELQKARWMKSQSKWIQIAPKLNLNQLKALIANVDLVIGNDTGPTHIAWGLNKPSITLFGCTPISRVYQTNINKVLKSSSLVNTPTKRC